MTQRKEIRGKEQPTRPRKRDRIHEEVPRLSIKEIDLDDILNGNTNNPFAESDILQFLREIISQGGEVVIDDGHENKCVLSVVPKGFVLHRK